MNLLDRFNKKVIGSYGKISDFTALITPSGDFKRVTDIEVILASWNNILLTPTGTYTWDPNFGTDLYKMIFEPADEETADKIKEEVRYKLTLYDDRARIEDIEIYFNPNKKGFSLDIKVDYKGEKSNLSAIIDENVYFNFMTR